MPCFGLIRDITPAEAHTKQIAKHTKQIAKHINTQIREVKRFGMRKDYDKIVGTLSTIPEDATPEEAKRLLDAIFAKKHLQPDTMFEINEAYRANKFGGRPGTSLSSEQINEMKEQHLGTGVATWISRTKTIKKAKQVITLSLPGNRAINLSDNARLNSIQKNAVLHDFDTKYAAAQKKAQKSWFGKPETGPSVADQLRAHDKAMALHQYEQQMQQMLRNKQRAENAIYEQGAQRGRAEILALLDGQHIAGGGAGKGVATAPTAGGSNQLAAAQAPARQQAPTPQQPPIAAAQAPARRQAPVPMRQSTRPPGSSAPGAPRAPLAQKRMKTPEPMPIAAQPTYIQDMQASPHHVVTPSHPLTSVREESSPEDLFPSPGRRAGKEPATDQASPSNPFASLI